jgi:transposase
LVTNLARETVPASDVVELYRLRWQIELLFKELKSYCNLKKFSTSNEDIVSTLIYASFITVLLKRLMAYSTKALKSLWISTQKTARTASSWLSLLVLGIQRISSNNGTLNIQVFQQRWECGDVIGFFIRLDLP